MAEKTVPLSARVSQEDADFLAEMKVQGAQTPSEKLRQVVRDARRRHHRSTDYPSALALAQEAMAPAVQSIRETERELAVHSELLTRMVEWLPELMAYVQSAPGMPGENAEARLRQLESGVALRITTIMQSVLQMSVTREGPFYDPRVLSNRVEPVLHLARVINQSRDLEPDSSQ